MLWMKNKKIFKATEILVRTMLYQYTVLNACVCVCVKYTLQATVVALPDDTWYTHSRHNANIAPRTTYTCAADVQDVLDEFLEKSHFTHAEDIDASKDEATTVKVTAAVKSLVNLQQKGGGQEPLEKMAFKVRCASCRLRLMLYTACIVFV